MTARKGIGGKYGGGTTQDGGDGSQGNIRIEYVKTYDGTTDPPATYSHITSQRPDQRKRPLRPSR